MNVLFTNFGSGTLAAPVNPADTTLALTAGQGALLPNPAGAQYFYLILKNAAGTVKEVVKVGTRVGDNLSNVTRAQDGTTAQAFSAGDTFTLGWVNAAIQDSLAGALQASNNLSDLANAATARTNLGLGTAAVLSAASLLLAANNLSDVSNAATARTNLGLGTAATQNVGTFAQVANNLSDLANAATARTNLGLGTAAVMASGDFLLVNNNLSDLNNVGTARTNLGLGTAATQNVGTFFQVANNLSEGNAVTMRANLGLGTAATQNLAAFLQPANNLSDVSNAATARTNLGLGTMATQNANAVNITGGSISGVVFSFTGGTLTGALLFNPDNSIDIGDAALTQRPRTIYLGTDVQAGRDVVAARDVTGTRNASFGGTLSASNVVAFGGAGLGATNIVLNLGLPAGLTAVSVNGVYLSGSIPSTATTSALGYVSQITTAAAAFTLPTLIHFRALGGAKGAGSTITNAFGFYADNAMAAGSSSYGFYSNINSAANTWQFFAAGSANSGFSGPVGIGTTPSSGLNAVEININGLSTLTSTTVAAVAVNSASPATATANHVGYMTQMNTVNAVFTLGSMLHFWARSSAKGASASVTNVFGFAASNTITGVGTNTYGFYSDIANAANTYQLFMGGTAESFFTAGVGIGQASGQSRMFRVGYTTWVTAASSQLVYLSGTVPATSSTAANGVYTDFLTANATVTYTSINHFHAASQQKGATDTITSVRGFYANNGIAIGTNNYGFYSDIAVSGNSNWQAYFVGSAPIYVGGGAGMIFAGAATDPIAGGYWLQFANTHPSTATTVSIIGGGVRAPATATVQVNYVRAALLSATAAYTLGEANYFFAETFTKGVGSTVTNIYGFRAANAIAQGTNNYGFYSDIANASNTFQYYAAGTARSFFNSPLGIGADAVITTNMLLVGVNATNNTAATLKIISVSTNTPSTATGDTIGFCSAIGTAAAAFTSTSIQHFTALSSSKGAGSTLTSVYGFVALNNIVVGTNNYGFWSNINSATTTWAFYGSGTAESLFNGAVAVGTNGTAASTQPAWLYIGGGANHYSSGTAPIGAKIYYTSPSTATGASYGLMVVAGTAAAAFTSASIRMISAETVSLGAGSSITAVYGIMARNAICVSATSNFGFYSDIAGNGGINWQLYMAGSAPSLFNGAVVEKEITETYSASITIDATTGNERIITVTNGTAFTINAPTNPSTGQYLEITIRNTSGGAMGVITWNAVFKMTAFTNPANGNSRTIVFRYNGTNWVEKGRTAADVPN